MTCIHVLSIICYIVSYKEKMRTIKQLATLASMPRMCLKRAYFWPQKTPLHPRSCRHSTLVCSTLIPTRVMSRHAVKLPANVGRNPLALSENYLSAQHGVTAHDLRQNDNRAFSFPESKVASVIAALRAPWCQPCDTYANAPVLRKAN